MQQFMLSIWAIKFIGGHRDATIPQFTWLTWIAIQNHESIIYYLFTTELVSVVNVWTYINKRNVEKKELFHVVPLWIAEDQVPFLKICLSKKKRQKTCVWHARASRGIEFRYNTRVENWHHIVYLLYAFGIIDSIWRA